MFEAKLIIGRYIVIPQATIAPVAYDPNVAAGFVSYANQNSRYAQLQESSTSGGMQTSNVVDGSSRTKLHRNFKWLPWHRGMVSYTNLDRDVLTGPMSGCVLTVYVEANGAEAGMLKVAHVGTMEADHAATPAVKQAWNQFASQPGSAVLGGFNPAMSIAKDTAGYSTGDVQLEIWGLVTLDRRFYAVQVFQQRANWNCYRIAKVAPALAMPQADVLSLA